MAEDKTVQKDESTPKPESESTCRSDNSSERCEKQHKGEQLNETKGRENENEKFKVCGLDNSSERCEKQHKGEQLNETKGREKEKEKFKETEITVCAGRWKTSRAKRAKRKKSSMHRKSKSTPMTSRVARNIQRSHSYESLPQLRIPISNVQPCYVVTPIPQFAMLHSIPSDTSQPLTGATVTPSEWKQQSNVPTPWYTGTHQNVLLHANTTANPVVHVTAEPNGYTPVSASADYSTVAPASSTAWEKTSDCTTSAPTNFNFDQYRDGDGLSGWDENQEYSAAPTHSNNESAPAQKSAGAIPVKTASMRTKPSTHKKNVHKKKQVRGRSLSDTTGSRRTARKKISDAIQSLSDTDAIQSLKEIMMQATARKKMSEAIQSLNEIMRQDGVPATPNNQNGIIQAAAQHITLLRAKLESATNQFAKLAERFATLASCPVPMLQSLGALPSLLPMPPLTSSMPSPPKSTPNPNDSDGSCNSAFSADRSFNFALSGEEGSPRPVHQLPLHPRPVMPAHPRPVMPAQQQTRRRRRRRKRQPQQQQTVPVHATSNSFAEEVRKRIHSRHESVGATDFAKLSMDQDTEHSDPGMSLDTTKMMTDGSLFNLNTHSDVDFLDPDFLDTTATADAGLLQSLYDLNSPQKLIFGTPPPSPRAMMSPASMCTSPTPDLF